MLMYLQGLTFGLAYVAPIGMQNLFVINTALTQPRRRAFLTALIVIFFDITLALACFFGVGALMERFQWLRMLVLLVGSDMFLSFTRWHCWQEILEMAALGVVSRMTGDLEQLRRQEAFLLQYGKIFLCDVPVYTVSSTKIRENRKNHTDFSCYLPQKVVQYIVSHNLYD